MTDYDYPPQRKRKAKVRLITRTGNELFNKRVEIHTGEPIGDWVEFRGMPHRESIRVALRRLPHDRFEGIVPDDEGPDE